MKRIAITLLAAIIAFNTFVISSGAENADRADKFLGQMIVTAKIDSYISSLVKRQNHRFVEVVLERIKRLSARLNASNSPS